MRRRSLSHRFASTLFGVWFALFSAVPGVWRPCPMHGAERPAARAAAKSAAGEMQCALGNAQHSGDSSQPTRSSTPAPAHACNCATNCNSAPAVALLDQPVRLETATLRVVESATFEPARRHLPSRVRLLPFANGPPAVVAG